MPAQRIRPQRRQELPTGGDGNNGTAADFERLYRANVADVTAYFARRSTDPQAVADLTAETFTAAITSFATFDPRKAPGVPGCSALPGACTPRTANHSLNSG